MTTQFRRVLIANRGEIAIRIIRACRDLGIESVAVYSDADVGALHVRMADRAARIGPPAPADSYLRIDTLLEVALLHGCDAVHPGYGFLAERATFARAVEEAGLAFIGPRSDVLDSLGDKLHARRLAREVGVAAVPGTLEPAAIGDPEAVAELARVAQAIGFPVLVKAAAGGGGRGMRRVVSAAELGPALIAASAEAAAAFGDGTVYLERQIARARHIEVQLLGDAQGDVVAIGERDCSIQRRHQKLVEEAPAPGLSRVERLAIHARAVAIARAVRLSNAATAEFLFTPEREFFFLEVNTRLQVEHGITELVSGLDLVREQLALATGAPLSAAVREAASRAADPVRHAIEVRLTAEDPGRDFAPTPGLVRHWVMPSGPGVRVDSGIEAGLAVAPEYDNLIAKVMVVGADRDAAIDRLGRALRETEIGGIQTTLPFYRFVAGAPAFRAGDLSTDWVEEHWDGAAAWRRAADQARLAAGLAVSGGDPVALATGRLIPSAATQSTRWRAAGRAAAIDRWPR